MEGGLPTYVPWEVREVLLIALLVFLILMLFLLPLVL